MSFVPVLPLSGYSGWLFLKKTQAQQFGAMQNQSASVREDEYFRQRVSGIETAEDLVADPRLLRIALTAFGLEADFPNKFFIRKVLEDGTLKTDSLANRLSDKRYASFARAFGFGDLSIPRTRLSDFADKLLEKYHARQFQAAVGDQNPDFRLALNVESELRDLASSSISEASKWYSVLGSPPLRQVFESAFGMPAAFAAIDIDKQVEQLQARVAKTFPDTTITQFADPESMQKLVRLFLLRAEIAASPVAVSSFQTALTLLQQGYGVRP